MATSHEFDQFWRQLTAHFPVREGLDAKLVGGEYFKFLSDLPGDSLFAAYGELVKSRKARTLPPVAEIRDAAGRFAGRPSGKPATWAELQALWAARWREADAILDRLFAMEACWQIREARALGFERAWRHAARRVVWERLRDGLDPERLPVLSFGAPTDGHPPGMQDHLRARRIGSSCAEASKGLPSEALA